MLYFHLEQMPDCLRELVARMSQQDAQAFESLKRSYFDAEQNRDWELSARILMQIGRCMQPQKPAITVFGGSGGSVLLDSDQIHLNVA